MPYGAFSTSIRGVHPCGPRRARNLAAQVDAKHNLALCSPIGYPAHSAHRRQCERRERRCHEGSKRVSIQVAAPAVVRVDGRTLAYDEVAPPNPRGTVLLLTGLGANRLGWARQMPVFGQQY